VVGDEDQSIYGWRGADIRNILEFEADFPGARVIKLEQNYRSTRTILEVASSVIRNNEMRKGKTLWTAEDGGDKVKLFLVDSAEAEAIAITERIEQNRLSGNLKDVVILYRTNAQSRPFEEQLGRRRIPYQIVGGISFYQRKEIKDIVAYLKLIANSADDVSFERIVNYPKRGIGQKTVTQIATLARQQGVSCYEIARSAASFPELSAKIGRIEPFVALIEEYRSRKDTQPIDLMTQDLVDALHLIEELVAEDAVVGQTRVDNLEAFIEGAAEYARTNGEAYLDNYLSEISLFTDVDSYREIDGKATLMTLHTAEGVEYATVYIVGLEEGLFPLQRAITEPSELEEERRLFYVGATRARERLCLSTASSRFRFSQVTFIPSRFIREIPEEFVDRVDMRTPTAQTYNHAPARANGADQRQTGAYLPRQGRYYEYEESELLRVGRVVAHPTFGRGTILRADGFGESLRLEIDFAGLGVKKILAKYARLKVVG
jgi:DNA helicase-2/ATP-dependent DNA helicase PcrA